MNRGWLGLARLEKLPLLRFPRPDPCVRSTQSSVFGYSIIITSNKNHPIQTSRRLKWALRNVIDHINDHKNQSNCIQAGAVWDPF